MNQNLQFSLGFLFRELSCVAIALGCLRILPLSNDYPLLAMAAVAGLCVASGATVGGFLGAMTHGCSSLCVPACTLGGVVAGLAVARVGNQRRAGIWFWPSSSGLALLTGSMGCACIGYSGVASLGIGFAAGVVPGLLRRTFAEKSP